MSALRMEVWAIHCPGSWQELHGSELTAAISQWRLGSAEAAAWQDSTGVGACGGEAPAMSLGLHCWGPEPLAETRGRCGETRHQCRPGHFPRAEGSRGLEQLYL